MRPESINKQMVARSFSRSATTYDQAASLQHEVAEHLLSLIPRPSREPSLLLDLGSGTGYNTLKLQKKFPKSHCLSIDLAYGMLKYAQQHYPDPNNLWFCADAEQLPLSSACCDLIFSSLMLQWTNYSQCFAEMQRVLQPNGLIAISTFGPKSLEEWKNSWLKLDLDPPIHVFSSEELLLQTLANTQLEPLFFQRKIFRKNYEQAIDLPIELKKLGANTPRRNTQASLAVKSNFDRALQAYEQQRNSEGFIPASYEIFFLIARKKHANN